MGNDVPLSGLRPRVLPDIVSFRVIHSNPALRPRCVAVHTCILHFKSRLQRSPCFSPVYRDTPRIQIRFMAREIFHSLFLRSDSADAKVSALRGEHGKERLRAEQHGHRHFEVRRNRGSDYLCLVRRGKFERLARYRFEHRNRNDLVAGIPDRNCPIARVRLVFASLKLRYDESSPCLWPLSPFSPTKLRVERVDLFIRACPTRFSA